MHLPVHCAPRPLLADPQDTFSLELFSLFSCCQMHRQQDSSKKGCLEGKHWADAFVFPQPHTGSTHKDLTLAACTQLKQCTPLIMPLLLCKQVAKQLQTLGDTSPHPPPLKPRQWADKQPEGTKQPSGQANITQQPPEALLSLCSC